MWFANDARDGRVLARIEGNQIDLSIACESLQFTGAWGAAPGQAARFYGTATNAGSGNAVPATLAAQPTANGLTVQLQDTQGIALGAPYELVRVAAPPSAATCP